MDIKTSPCAIAKRIKDLREKKGETQKELAAALHCNQNNISKIENGKSLTSDNLIAIAAHYHVSMDYLCKGEGGADLLDTLGKYIHYKLEIINYIDSHLVPHIEINQSLYHCLRQLALATRNSEMPQNIKEQWKKEIIERFNNEIISDNYNQYVSFAISDKPEV